MYSTVADEYDELEHVTEGAVNTLKNDRGKDSARSAFLHKLGFNWDPFVTPVSEQELSLAYTSTVKMPAIPETAVLSYFIPPKNPAHPSQPVLHDLRQSQPAFIFGQPGQGKTSLRLAFEAQCRSLEDPSLAVLYEIGPDFNQTMTLEEHWQRLSRQLAIDLFIQVIERFQPETSIVNEDHICILSKQMRIGGRPLQRLAERIIEDPQPVGTMGIANRWLSVGRLAVRKVTKSAELVHLLRQALMKSREEQRPLETGWSQLVAGIQAARTWGFQRVFILVDGVDNWQRETDEMFHLIEPLLKETFVLQEQLVYCKFFLPSVLQPSITTFWQQNYSAPNSDAYFITLSWDKIELKRLLEARFRASGSRRKGFDDLSTNEFAESLDDLLIQQSHGSPRELLKLVNELINETAVVAKMTEGQKLPDITLQMWQEIIKSKST